MHIVQYFHRPLPVKEYGGLERVIVWLIKGLKELGHTVTLVGPSGSTVDCDKAVLEGSGAVPSSDELKAVLPAGADVVHFHYDGKTDVSLGIPTLTTLHGYGKAEVRPKLGPAYCFVSDAHRREWNQPDNPFIYNGLDPSEYRYLEKKDDYFLFLSRIDWDVKGLPWAIEAAKQAGVRLIIAGNYHRRSFVNSAWRGLKKHLNERCFYVGPVGGNLKTSLFAGSRALIFPTLWPEPCTIVALEALASGTPVITTYNGAMPEMVEHGKHGFLCKDIAEMTDAIKRIDSIRSVDCLNRINEIFNYKRMAQQYIALYESLIGRS